MEMTGALVRSEEDPGGVESDGGPTCRRNFREHTGGVVVGGGSGVVVMSFGIVVGGDVAVADVAAVSIAAVGACRVSAAAGDGGVGVGVDGVSFSGVGCFCRSDELRVTNCVAQLSYAFYGRKNITPRLACHPRQIRHTWPSHSAVQASNERAIRLSPVHRLQPEPTLVCLVS